MTSLLIGRMLRDITPVESKKVRAASARCSTYGETRLKRHLLPRILFLVVFIFVTGGGLWAQTTGTIRGTVADPSGAVVPGAHVTAILAQAYVNRATQTNAEGEYVFPALPVGRYTVVVKAPGFQECRQSEVEVQIGHVTLANVGLELGTLAQVVTAEAQAPLVETTNTQMGAVVSDRMVTQLPLNARDTYQLLQLQPGVQSQLGSDLFYGSDQAGVVSVNGGRGRANNYTVNGGDANDQFANLPAIQPSPDSIEEFRVMTSTFDAEFGRNSGSVVNVVTKSGGNVVHGNLYEFLRNQHLNARNFFEGHAARLQTEPVWRHAGRAHQAGSILLLPVLRRPAHPPGNSFRHGGGADRRPSGRGIFPPAPPSPAPSRMIILPRRSARGPAARRRCKGTPGRASRREPLTRQSSPATSFRRGALIPPPRI